MEFSNTAAITTAVFCYTSVLLQQHTAEQPSSSNFLAAATRELDLQNNSER